MKYLVHVTRVAHYEVDADEWEESSLEALEDAELYDEETLDCQVTTAEGALVDGEEGENG